MTVNQSARRTPAFSMLLQRVTAEPMREFVVPAEGRNERFDGSFRAHYGRVFEYARRRVGDRATAEDVAAETFVVAWRRWDQAPTDELPWLLGIARRVISNEVRGSRRRDRLAARIGSERDPVLGDPPSDHRDEMVLSALARLSPRDREVLFLSVWEGLDNKRAAAVLGCSVSAFAVRLHRARTRLVRDLPRSPSVSTPRFLDPEETQ